MATKREQLEVQLVATDKASGVIKGVADQADKAADEVQDLIRRIAALSDSDKKVVLTAEASKLEREVKRATVLLGQVDGAEAEAVLDAKNQAQSKLDAVQSELDGIDNRTADATVDVDDNASGDIGRVDGKLDELDRRTVDATIDADAGPGLTGLLDGIGGMPGSLGEAGGIMSSLTSGGGAAVALAGVLAGAATHAADVATEVQQIGAFADLSAEDASRLRAVFRDNGVEVQDLLDLIGQMSGVLADNPQLVTDMGISMDTVRQGPLAVLTAVMSKFWADGKLSDAERIVAMQLFGEEGVRQVNAVASLIGGDLQGAMDDVAESRVLGDDDIENAQEFTRAWQDVRGNVDAIVMSLGGPLLDALSSVAGPMAEAFGPIGDWYSRLLDGRMEQIVGPLRDLPDNMSRLFGRPTSEDTENQRSFWNAVITGAVNAGEAQDEATEATFDYTQATADATAAHEAFIDVLHEQVDALDGQIDGYEAAAAAQLKLEDRVDSMSDAVADYSAAVDEHGASSDQAADALRRVRDAAIDVAKAQVAVMEAENQANGVTTTRVARIDRENRVLLEQAAQLDGPMRNAILSHVMRLNGIPDSRITEILTDTDPDNLAQTTAELDGPANKRRVAAIQADADDASIRAAENALNWASRPRSAFITPTYTSPSGRGFTAAGGASYSNEGTYLVGEQGPELVHLPTGSRVDPNPGSSRGGGSTTVNYVTNNLPRGLDAREFVRAQNAANRRTGGGYRP